MKKISTEYIDAKKEIENQINNYFKCVDKKTKKQKKGQDNRRISWPIIHIHADYGTGKSILVNDLKFKDSIEPIVIDEKIASKQEAKLIFSNSFSKKYSDNISALVDKQNVINKSLKWIYYFLTFVSTIAIGMIPVYMDTEIKNIHIDMIPLYLSLLLIFFSYPWIKHQCFIANKRGKKYVLIIENIDRCEWDVIDSLLHNAYTSSKCKNDICGVIFTYDMNNLSDRYKEYQNWDINVNLYSKLDKYITHEIILEKYEDQVKPIIFNKIIEDVIINFDKEESNDK